MDARKCDWCGKVMDAKDYEKYVEFKVTSFIFPGIPATPKYYHLCKDCYNNKFKKMKVE